MIAEIELATYVSCLIYNFGSLIFKYENHLLKYSLLILL